MTEWTQRRSLARRLGLAMTLLLAGPGGSFGQADTTAPSSAVAVMDVGELKVGQQGHGYSVFAGEELERFELEILGVLQNTAPGEDQIIARLRGQGLEHSGVVAGMSGSPVYVQDRLVGAVAYSWAFAKEPIAGITPIRSMREIGKARSGTGSVGGSPGTGEPATLESLLGGGESRERLSQAFARLQPASTRRSQPALGWAVGGFSAAAEGRLAQFLGPLAATGRVKRGGDGARLVPGSPVAAVLVDGDLRLAATGTVTERVGDDLIAFGHPFYALGAVSIPMAEAEVITVMPSQANSFKLSNLGPIVGSIVEDRQAGVRGRIGRMAETTPLTLRLRTPEVVEFRMDVARIPQLTPALVAVSTLGAQAGVATTTGPLGIDLRARFDLGEVGEVVLDQSFDGATAATDAALFVMSYVNFFLQNSFAEVPVEAIELDLVQHPDPRTAILVGGYADRTKVRPGEVVGLNLEFVPYRGEPIRHRLELDLPADLPSGRYSLLVGDGVTIDLQRQKVEPASPIRFDQALRVIQGFHSRRDLVVLGVHAGRGLAVGGEVLPRLPGSMQSIWTAASSKSAVPLRLAVAQEHTERLEVPISGGVRIDLDVRRPDPMTADPGSDGNGGEGESGGEPGAGDGSGAPGEEPAVGRPLGSAAEES